MIPDKLIWEASDRPSEYDASERLRHHLSDEYIVVHSIEYIKDILHRYLTGQQFKQRFEAMLDAYKDMKTDLDKERTAMERIWAKREKQIEQVVGNLAGMHGDLEGIIGNSMPQIESLELKKIADGS